MKIGLVVSERITHRRALKIALELDERLASQGAMVSLLDLQDQSFVGWDLGSQDIVVIVTENEGQVYGSQLHQLLVTQRIALINKPIGTVVVSEEQILAESADTQLKSILKTLGSELIPEKLIIIDADSKFDNEFNLRDSQLNLALYRYLHSVLDFNELRKSA